MYFTWHLNVLVEIIISKYFPKTFCIMHIYDKSSEAVYLSAPHFNVKNVEYFRLDPRRTCRNFLIQCEDPAKAFNHVETVIKFDSDGWYNNRKYLIVVSNESALEEFFNSTFLTFVADILIMYTSNISTESYNIVIEDNLGAVYLYTHNYIGEDGNNNPTLLDIWYPWNQSYKIGEDLFPDKVRNQKGRKLRAPCIARMPYANCDPEIKDGMGNEHHIILKYVKRHNFTVDYFPKNQFIGRINTNFTGTGFRGGLLYEDGYYDVVYGGFPQSYHTDWIRTVIFTYEVSVPLPRIQYGWLYVFEIFQTTIWMLLLGTFTCLCAVINVRRLLFKTIIRERSKIKTIELFGLFVNQSCGPSQELENSFFLKFMVLLVLFGSILICAAYNSRLSSVMVAPTYENDIKTLAECANSNYKILFFDNYYAILKEDTRVVYKKLFEKIELISRFEDGSQDYNLSEKLLSSRKYAVARYRRSTGGYYEDYEHLMQMYGRYKPITPELFTNYYFFLLRKNSMHTEPLRNLVTTAKESGLMRFWEEQAMRGGDNVTFQMKLLDNKVDTRDHNLHILNLKGCFAFWAFCMIVSLGIFLQELCNCRSRPIVVGNR